MKLEFVIKKEYKQNIINLLQKYEFDMFDVQMYFQRESKTYYFNIETENSLLSHEIIDVVNESKEIIIDGAIKNCLVCGNCLSPHDYTYDKLCSQLCRDIYNAAESIGKSKDED